jgi:hypothetical protein
MFRIDVWAARPEVTSTVPGGSGWGNRVGGRFAAGPRRPEDGLSPEGAAGCGPSAQRLQKYSADPMA